MLTTLCDCHKSSKIKTSSPNTHQSKAKVLHNPYLITVSEYIIILSIKYRNRSL